MPTERGTDQSHVAKLTIYLTAGSDMTAGYQAAAEVWGNHPTAITALRSPASRGRTHSWKSTPSGRAVSRGQGTVDDQRTQHCAIQIGDTAINDTEPQTAAGKVLLHFT